MSHPFDRGFEGPLGHSFKNRFGVTLGNFQQHSSSTRRLSPALLPVLQRVHTDAEDTCELGLTESEFSADRDHTAGFDAIDTGNRAFVAAQGTAKFTHALE